VHIGLLQLYLRLPGIQSLKGKRQILQSMKDRIRQQANVSIAEIGLLDSWQESEMAVVTLSNDPARVHQVLESVLKMVESTPEILIADQKIEML
jgi:uncharacterized protein YlxP (DUF503 family)